MHWFLQMTLEESPKASQEAIMKAYYLVGLAVPKRIWGAGAGTEVEGDQVEGSEP